MSIPESCNVCSTACKTGFFGPFGGQFVPDELKRVLNDVTEAFLRYKDDPEFNAELADLFAHYCGRPTPVFHCRNLSRELGGAQIYLKREDLNHLGAHKLNNTLGQVLLARRMGKTRIVAETGAGQHGVAAAATAAMFGMECIVYMGEEDMKRQHPNVVRMRMMGAEVRPAMSGQRTLKEAVDEALDFFVANPDVFYVLGSAVGPHPYPVMVRHFQSVISREARRQCLEQIGRLPDYAIACVGGGSNAIGMFASFIDDVDVRLVGAEPGGRGLAAGQNAASLSLGAPGILHGFNGYILRDEKGEVAPVYSISAGLDYPGVGPEHCYLKETGRAEYVPVFDDEAVEALLVLSRKEGIIPALESSHALAHAMKIAPGLDRDKVILVCLSGRGDKDLEQLMDMLKDRL